MFEGGGWLMKFRRQKKATTLGKGRSSEAIPPGSSTSYLGNRKEGTGKLCPRTWFMFFNSLVYSSNTSCSNGVTPADVRLVRLRRGFEGSWLFSFIMVAVSWTWQSLEERQGKKRDDCGIRVGKCPRAETRTGMGEADWPRTLIQ